MTHKKSVAGVYCLRSLRYVDVHLQNGSKEVIKADKLKIMLQHGSSANPNQVFASPALNQGAHGPG